MKKSLIFVLFLLVQLELAKSNTQNEYIQMADSVGLKVLIDSVFSQVEIVSSDSSIVRNVYFFQKSQEPSFWLLYIWPCITIFIAFLLPIFYEYILNKRKINNIGRTWLVELQSLEDPIEREVDKISNSISELQANEHKLIPLVINANTSLNGENFKYFDKSYLVEYLKKVFNGDSKLTVNISNEIHGYIFGLVDIQNRFRETIQNYASHIRGFTLELSAIQHELSLATRRYLASETLNVNGYNESQRGIISIFNSMFVDESGRYNLDPLEMVNKFYNPLISEIAKLSADGDESASHIGDIASRCLEKIMLIKKEKEYLVRGLKRLKMDYEKKLVTLPTLVRKINK